MRTGERSVPAARHRQRGFGYIGVLFAVAALGIGLAATGELWSTTAQREREAELLRVGAEFRRAIAAYYASTRTGMPAFPARLEELLEDRRGPALRRHLRRIYVDPMTGTQDWGLIEGADGRIRGVFSRSEHSPLRSTGFTSVDKGFVTARNYGDWRFEFTPRNIPAAAPAR